MDKYSHHSAAKSKESHHSGKHAKNYPSGKNNESERRSFHASAQSHKSKKSKGSYYQNQPRNEYEEFDNKFNMKYKLPSISAGASSASRKSKESNGFRQTMTKPGRIYNDGTATYFSGRVHITTKPEFNQTSSKTFNRTLRDRDTFLTIFPNYRIARDHKNSTMRKHFKYPSMSVEGNVPHFIDRTYTRKMDFMKKYTEEMLKVASMKRVIK